VANLRFQFREANTIGMSQQVAQERLRQDVAFLVEYLSAVQIPDFGFLRGRTELLLSHINELSNAVEANDRRLEKAIA
jgi:hypothetical protein